MGWGVNSTQVTVDVMLHFSENQVDIGDHGIRMAGASPTF